MTHVEKRKHASDPEIIVFLEDVVSEPVSNEKTMRRMPGTTPIQRIVVDPELSVKRERDDRTIRILVTNKRVAERSDHSIET